MIQATREDKSLIISILADAFDANRSINYLVQQDDKRLQRVRAVVDYSFELCYRYGRIYLSEDRKACALILFPDKKRTTLRTLLLDLQLIFSAIGIRGIPKALRREAVIKKHQPQGEVYYLWFIAVAPDSQGKGKGAKLLHEIMAEARREGKPILLETSTPENLPWYQKAGFTLYHQLDMGYTVYFLQQVFPS